MPEHGREHRDLVRVKRVARSALYGVLERQDEKVWPKVLHDRVGRRLHPDQKITT